MNVTISKSAPALSGAELDRFEQSHHRQIPAVYRKFLLEHNGGQPDPSEFRMRSGSTNSEETGAVKRFFGINTTEHTLDLAYALETFKGRIPDLLFPIARDPGGNLIGIATEGPDQGHVLFWDHEREADEGQPPSQKNLYLIANSFEEFLSGLA